MLSSNLMATASIHEASTEVGTGIEWRTGGLQPSPEGRHSADVLGVIIATEKYKVLFFASLGCES